jgi:predicted site-specific integrase-resolvase
MEIKNDILRSLCETIEELYPEKIEAVAKKDKKKREIVYFKVKTGKSLNRGQIIYVTTWDNEFTIEPELIIRTTIGSIHLFKNKQLIKLMKLVGQDYNVNVFIKKNSNIVLYSRLPYDTLKLERKAEIAMHLADLADEYEEKVMETDIH